MNALNAKIFLLVISVAGLFMNSACGGDSVVLRNNEINAYSYLRDLVEAEEVLKMDDADRNGRRDYWAADVSGLYRLLDAKGDIIALIKKDIALADYDPVPESDKPAVGPALTDSPVPFKGYYYSIIPRGPGGKPYAGDANSDGLAYENVYSFAFCAFPAEYGVTGIKTFIVSDKGFVYWQDTGGEPVDSFPSNADAEGWNSGDPDNKANTEDPSAVEEQIN